MTQFIKAGFLTIFMLLSFPAFAQSDHRPVDYMSEFRRKINLSDFHFVTPQDRQSGFDAYKGSWVLVNLWATWCPPCISELKTFEDLDFITPDEDFKVLALSVDQQRKGQLLKKFLEDIEVYELDFAYDPLNNALRVFKYRGLPTTFLIDPELNVRAYYEGVADWSHPDTIKAIYAIIKPEGELDTE